MTRTRSLSLTVAAGLAFSLCAGTLHAQGRGSGDVPPGLAKKGGLPPGQAKKLYRPDDGIVVLRDVFSHHGYTVVRTTREGESRIVFYRLRSGPIRRVIIRPGPERPVFMNVPDPLMHEIAIRMY
jgi:hypothetical protein